MRMFCRLHFLALFVIPWKIMILFCDIMIMSEKVLVWYFLNILVIILGLVKFGGACSTLAGLEHCGTRDCPIMA